MFEKLALKRKRYYLELIKTEDKSNYKIKF